MFKLARLTKIISTILISTIFFTPLKVQAVDAWGAAAQAAGVFAVYQSMLSSMLSLGNNVDAQMSARFQDIKANGQDKNKIDVELVNKIMTRLIENATYELKANSLPFVWIVNNSEQFNASCYPMNYVSINRGLVRGLNLNVDEIAAVLAHEMTHGIEQHSAKNYAKAVATQMGAMMIGMDANSKHVDWNKLSGMVNYSIAKAITLPTEHDADEGGFFLMTSAGFNPGGGAAAMARMDYYVRFETEDIFEYDPHDKPNEQTFSDHPDSEVREEKLSKLMTDYSFGHVTVEKIDRNYRVLIDGREIYLAQENGEFYKSAEKAYLFAGGLAKAFHDLKNFSDWNFRTSSNRTDFLTDDNVFKTLREESFTLKLGDKIKSAVEQSYKIESPLTRQNYLAEENKRLQAWQKIKSEAVSTSKNSAKKLRENADTYNDYGQGELALIEISRALQAKNQDDIAECLGIRARAKAICGDYDGALADANQSVAQDAKNLYNFLNRADVRHMRGELNFALADIDSAISIDKKNAISYKLQGEIFDELGEVDKATESFRNCYNFTKKNPNAIPLNYLEKIDNDAYKKIQKQKADAESKNKKSDSEKSDTK